MRDDKMQKARLTLVVSRTRYTDDPDNTYIHNYISDLDLRDSKYIIERTYPFSNAKEYISVSMNGDETVINSGVELQLLSNNIILIRDINNQFCYIYNMNTNNKVLIDYNSNSTLMSRLVYLGENKNGVDYYDNDKIYFYRQSSTYNTDKLLYESVYSYNIDTDAISEEKSVFTSKDGICLYYDDIDVLRVQLSSGDVVRYLGDDIPNFMLDGEFYYFDSNISTLTFNKITINNDGSILSQAIISVYDTITTNGSIEYNLIWKYNMIGYYVTVNSVGGILKFDGNNLNILDDKHTPFYRQSSSYSDICDLGDRIMVFNDSYAQYLEKESMNISQYNMPSKNLLLETGIENTTFYTSIVGGEIHYIFEGRDYNTGEEIYGKITADGSVVYAETEDEIMSLYYDQEISVPEL